jgi:hypothetical protein
LEAHKDQIKEMMATSNDPAALQEIGPSLKQELLSYIREKPRSGESIMDQINQSLASLEEISKKTHRLASAKGLTLQEKKARRAIAVLAQAIDTKREQIVSVP